ncbi:putative peroxidase-related enzyme [Roseivirga ehrenbergii]|uniref:Alkylhydroperoxidase n=1 Tax=Roseivirga ehrenbergii (strain DSM 102268 / JCM 13514 / KCTC 12282 / NCIMB 14502 / KMM 6017) TaxID=279360 RepID=A0A150WY08_ROSEK|nr:carboxymuconolactone decarboxylase family protein [Roseivirga ehrenbergii]KYG71370.1 alkylhydroperoxidase [Roseivirga ehrenbergii]TCK99584.1 putative peroxidase-related enzyme [Roseivirga ehrenbergii]
MRKFEVPTREQVAPAAQAIFDGVKQKIGMVPNIYATIGYSANALDSYLTFQGAQAKGSFNAKEREAAALAVAQANGCSYCQAAHTAIGKMNGFSEEETLNLRTGKSENARLNAIVALAREITLKHGRPSSETVENFFAQGFDNAALMDLVLLVADNTVTNYVNNVTEIAIDFPVAKPLEEVIEA